MLFLLFFGLLIAKTARNQRLCRFSRPFFCVGIRFEDFSSIRQDGFFVNLSSFPNKF